MGAVEDIFKLISRRGIVGPRYNHPVSTAEQRKVISIQRLGVPSSPKSVVFLTLFKRGGGGGVKPFWQQKIDIKRLFKGRNVSIWGKMSKF